MKPELGTLYFDGNCHFCRTGVMRLQLWLAQQGVTIAPFPTGEGQVTPDEMKLRCVDGRELGGAKAALEVIAAAGVAGRLLAWLGRLPIFFWMLDAGYRAVAKRRHCIGGACELRPPKRRRVPLSAAWGVGIFLTLSAGVIAAAINVTGWVMMWMLATAMWLGFKLLALATTASDGWPRGVMAWIGYGLWPGMDVAAFADRRRPAIYREVEWKVAVVAGVRVLVGSWLIAVVGMAAAANDPVAAGWCVMTGLVLTLHFGVFDLLALFWRRVGFDVERLMDAPWRAHSLADFWGGRWNRAFSQVANRALFRPMTRRFGLAGGTLAGFGLSGLVHEVVISLPAGAGFGLPTTYFLIQGCGVLVERRLGWRGTRKGRVLMWLVLAGPAFWLFHPAFMQEVLVPMVRAFSF